MTYLIERFAELRRYLEHLRKLRPLISGRETLQQNFSLRNDVLFSLLMICQLVLQKKKTL